MGSGEERRRRGDVAEEEDETAMEMVNWGMCESMKAWGSG
jgi:hypothetical protein